MRGLRRGVPPLQIKLAYVDEAGTESMAYPHEISLSETHKVSCYRYYEKNGKGGEA